MITGSTLFQFRRFAVMAIAAAVLAGCSSENNQAPISAIGGTAGGHSGNAPLNNVRPAATPQMNSSVPSGPGTGMTVASPRVESASAVPAQTPVRTENGHIVYNRSYGNIPKGSYNGPTYTVKRGDTLFYIAWITGNDFRDLAQRNNVAAPYSLSVGQVL